MNKNSLGNISNVKIEVESDFSEGNYLNSEIKGKFDCINIEISYMESMPSVKNIFNSMKIINDKIIFNINSGNSKNLF